MLQVSQSLGQLGRVAFPISEMATKFQKARFPQGPGHKCEGEKQNSYQKADWL